MEMCYLVGSTKQYLETNHRNKSPANMKELPAAHQ